MPDSRFKRDLMRKVYRRYPCQVCGETDPEELVEERIRAGGSNQNLSVLINGASSVPTFVKTLACHIIICKLCRSFAGGKGRCKTLEVLQPINIGDLRDLQRVQTLMEIEPYRQELPNGFKLIPSQIEQKRSWRSEGLSTEATEISQPMQKVEDLAGPPDWYKGDNWPAEGEDDEDFGYPNDRSRYNDWVAYGRQGDNPIIEDVNWRRAKASAQIQGGL